MIQETLNPDGPLTAQDAKRSQSPMNESSCPLDMSRFLIMDFVTTLEHEAVRCGTLDVGSLRALAETFLSQLRGSTPAPESCVQLHQQLLWDERRRHPFERLIIRRFAHLLPKRIGDDGVIKGATLSRRAIPGLAVAVTKMVGLDQYRAWESATHDLLRRHKQVAPGPIDWSALARQPDVVRLLDQALVRMAPYFSDLDKRTQWLIEVVNSHLGPPQPEDGPDLWVMDPLKATVLLLALYDDLRQRLPRDGEALEALYGSRAFAALHQLDKALKHAEQKIATLAIIADQAPSAPQSLHCS